MSDQPTEAAREAAELYDDLATRDYPPKDRPELASFGDWEHQLLMQIIDETITAAVKAEREWIMSFLLEEAARKRIKAEKLHPAMGYRADLLSDAEAYVNAAADINRLSPTTEPQS